MPVVNLDERLFRLEQQLMAYQKLHADELAELWQELNACKREIGARQSARHSPTGAQLILRQEVRVKETSMTERSEKLRARLARGERLLLDGGTGSELQRRGVNLSHGVAEGDGVLGAWSATAMHDAPEVVRAIHEDYLRVGADIITANSYNTNRGQLGRAGLAHKMEEFSRLAIELACEARDKMNPEAYVAGSVAPTWRMPAGWDPARVPPADELLREWGDQVAVLAEAGADLILIETMSSIAMCLPAVEVAARTGLPVFLGIHATPEGTMTSGETMAELVAALGDNKPDAILLMCRSPEEISATLPNLRAAFDGPVGAYANIGYHKARQPSAWQYHEIQVGEYTPRSYAQFCNNWLEMGVQIVGGCCASTPEHIAVIYPLVKGERLKG